jgi:hypothetical protein
MQYWFGIAVAVLAAGFALDAPAVDYDVVYVRQPRHGDDTYAKWPDVFHPAELEQGCDLMLLHPDGSEEVLVAGGDGAVTDPMLSFDAQWVYYAYFPDMRDSELNGQRSDLPYAGSDIYRIHLDTRQIERLTHQEFQPNLGAGTWDESNPVNPPSNFNRLGYGILNLGPCPLAGGKIAFVSNRNGYTPTKSFTGPTLQIFVMDEDGRNVTAISPMVIGSALHPTPLRDGRIMFSSYESQGLRDRRNWGIWSIWPDGRTWEPIVSSFKSAGAFHFMTQLGNGDIVVEDYYNLNNFGFGALYRIPADRGGEPGFYSAFPGDNPGIEQTVGGGFLYPFKMAFTPRNMYSITPFTHGGDEAAPEGENGERVGKFTHPSAAPDNDLLVVWSPGPVNKLTRPVNRPAPDAGLYVIPGGDIVNSPNELELIKNDPAYNEVWPRAVVPYSATHGVEEPDELPWLPNDGTAHEALPAGTPYGLIGTSSFYKRESFPGFVRSWADTFDGLDAFNTSENGQSSNWGTQGADAGRYDDAEIWAVRILAMEPNTHRSYGPENGSKFYNFANERLRILGEIPLRKGNGLGQELLDPEGNPDTSFLAKIPADTPFTFQTIDRNGLSLNMAQTWHQVRPGEVRTDCGGCHAHSQEPLTFELTAAAKPEYSLWDLVNNTPLVTEDVDGDPAIKSEASGVIDVEFYRDIRPILETHCTPCHTESDPTPPGNLVLDDTTLYSGYPGDYARLCRDSNAQWGHPPLVTVGGDPRWRQTNASRYVRRFQSRRSLLVWKVFGERLDGWSNADHPTESTPGDPDTLPDGASINEADLDFTGSVMPPPDSGVPPLTADQKITIARWIDLGCPINIGEESGQGQFGWFLDDLRPTVAVSVPRAGANEGPVTEIRVGLADATSGVNHATFSVTADIPIGDRLPGAELADLFIQTAESVYRLPLVPSLPAGTVGTLYAEVADRQGNVKRVERSFSVTGEANPLDDDALDVNGDGFVNIVDIQTVVVAILGQDVSPATTDVDGSGVTNVVDLFAIVHHVLNT